MGKSEMAKILEWDSLNRKWGFAEPAIRRIVYVLRETDSGKMDEVAAVQNIRSIVNDLLQSTYVELFDGGSRKV